MLQNCENSEVFFCLCGLLLQAAENSFRVDALDGTDKQLLSTKNVTSLGILDTSSRVSVDCVMSLNVYLCRDVYNIGVEHGLRKEYSSLGYSYKKFPFPSAEKFGITIDVLVHYGSISFSNVCQTLTNHCKKKWPAVQLIRVVGAHITDEENDCNQLVLFLERTLGRAEK